MVCLVRKYNRNELWKTKQRSLIYVLSKEFPCRVKNIYWDMIPLYKQLICKLHPGKLLRRQWKLKAKRFNKTASNFLTTHHCGENINFQMHWITDTVKFTKVLSTEWAWWKCQFCLVPIPPVSVNFVLIIY